MSYSLSDLNRANTLIDANIERSQDARVLNFEKIAQYIDGNVGDAADEKFLNIDESNFTEMTGIVMGDNGNIDMEASQGLVKNEDGTYGIKNNELVMEMLGSSAIFSNYEEAGEGRREKKERKRAKPEKFVIDSSGNLSLVMRREDGILAPLTKFRTSDPLDPVSFANGEGLRTALNGVININKQRLGADQRGLGSIASAVIGKENLAEWLAMNSTGDAKTDAGQLESVAENGGDLAQVTALFQELSGYMTAAGDAQQADAKQKKPEDKDPYKINDTLDIDSPFDIKDKDAEISEDQRTTAIDKISNPQGDINEFLGFGWNMDSWKDRNPQLNNLELAFPDYVEGNTEHPFGLSSEQWDSYTQNERDLINSRSKEVAGRTVEDAMSSLDQFFDGYQKRVPDDSGFGQSTYGYGSNYSSSGTSLRSMGNAAPLSGGYSSVRVPGLRDKLSDQNLSEAQVEQSEKIMQYYDTEGKGVIQKSLRSPAHVRALKENPLKYIQRVQLGLDPIGQGPRDQGKDTTVEVAATGNTLQFPDYDSDPEELKQFIDTNYDEILRMARDGNVLSKVQALLNDPLLRIEDPVDLVRVDRYDPKHDINAYELASAMAFAEGGGAGKDGFYEAVDKNLNFILRGGRDITALQQNTFNRSAQEAEQRIKATILNNREVNRQKAQTDFTSFNDSLGKEIIELSKLLYARNTDGNIDMKNVNFAANPEAAVRSQTIFNTYMNAPEQYRNSPEVLGQMQILYGMHLHQLALSQGIDDRNFLQRVLGLSDPGGNFQEGVAPLGGFKIRLEPTGRRDPETGRFILGPDGKPEQQIAEGFFTDSTGQIEGKVISGRDLTDAFGGDTRAFVLLQLFASER